MTDKPILRVDSLSKTYRTREESLPVLDDVSFSMSHGEFIGLIGPSGCGKSTLLKAIAHIETVDTGHIEWVDANERGRSFLSYTFQHLALFPWLTVEDNIRFPLTELQGGSAAWETVQQAVANFGLEGFGGYYPSQLSGGMRQRVALARAMITRPELLVLDEPFGALDVCARLRLQQLVLTECARLGTSTIIVTHDLGEAARMCDRILVFSPRPARIHAEIMIDGWTREERTKLEAEDVASKVGEIQHSLWMASAENCTATGS